jgi:poly-gamma-glutamate synthesis protein (capsule biosynthesis protein)
MSLVWVGIMFFFSTFVFPCSQDVIGVALMPIPSLVPIMQIEDDPELKQESEPESEMPQEHYLTFIAAGDNLFHNELYESSLQDGVYQFDSIYEKIKPFIEPADIAFINQETLLAGEEYGYSSYPQFNTPQELGNTLADTGFDVVSHANNHVMDKGAKAAISTLNFWDTVPGVQMLGIYESQEARDNRQIIIEKNNIKMGFLAYTFSTNSIPIPSDMPYLVSMTDEEIMAKEIDALRPLCDVLVVSIHWGDEYQHEPNTDQKTWSAFLAEHNVDIALGHHPHVLQPYEYIERTDGKKMLCYYSLGNFVSGQDQSPRLLGGMAFIKIKKDDSGVTIEEANIIPVITHYSTAWDGFTVYPFYDYTEELLSTHWITWKNKDINMEYFTTIIDNVFEEEVMKTNPFQALSLPQ